MKKRKLISVLVAASMVASLVLSGCGSGGSTDSDSGSKEDTKKEDSAKSSDGEYTIVVMPKLVGIPYFTATGDGAVKAGEDIGVNVIYNGPTTADAAQQVTMIEDYITQGVDAICVAPNDAAAMEAVLKKAKDAGIIILDWDTQANKDLVDASIHNIDDKAFGEHMMEELVKFMGTEDAQWAIVTGGLSAENLNTWIKYATEYAEANYPDLELVADPYPTDEKQDVAYSTTQDLLKAYPDVKGILGMSTPTGPGCALAIRDLGLQDEVSLVANAMEDDVKDVLSDGSLDMGCLWSCNDLGYLTVCVANALLDGKTLEDGMEVEGWGTIEVQDGKNVILGPAEDYVK